MHFPNKPQQWLLSGYTYALLWLLWTSSVSADCNTYSPAFPLPKLDPNSNIIRDAHHEIETLVRKLIDEDPSHDTTSYSIAVTSSKETLFEFHRTAPLRDETRPGAPIINGSTCYRIASCTKPFTVLALLQQHKAGKIASLDDPINKYVSALNDPNQNGSLPWKDITLRTLASQLSGIPRDIGQSDMLVDLDDPVSHGLPPLKSPADHHEIICDSFTNYTQPCTASDLFARLLSSKPIFPPKATSTYSNLAFELLGLALENVTSTPYTELIQTTILGPLNLTSTSFTTPPDSVAALPLNNSQYWPLDIGIQNPTGGLYSSSNNLAAFARNALSTYNGLSPALNWFHPISPSTGLNTFYGLPWEIYRTSALLPHTSRPVTLVTKGGALPGYWTSLTMIPDHDLGIAILFAAQTPPPTTHVLELVAGKSILAAESIAQQTLASKYAGTFTHPSLNSSITFSHSPRRGLWISSWLSNSTSLLSEFDSVFFPGLGGSCADVDCYLQAVPTLLFKDEENQRGEIWRLIGHKVPAAEGWLRSGFCLTDVDLGLYGGVSVNEVVFWEELDGDTGFGRVELSGLRVGLGRVEREDGEEGEGMGLRVQEL